MTLAELELKQAYHKPEDDVAEGFYLPCMARAISYDRAVGFFSSAIYALAWPSLERFVRAGGKIRMICSPILSGDDQDAVEDGYSARAAGVQGELLRDEYRRLLRTPGLLKPAQVLAALVALEVLEFRIAWVGEVVGGKPRRLFHDKLGLFRDAAGNVVAFKGSMNETFPGLSADGNLESVDVFVSWGGSREHARVTDEITYFERLWGGDFPGVITRPLPDVAREALITAADVEHWPELVEQICIEIRAGNTWAPAPQKQGRVPRPHQVEALEAWRARGRRGIFEHATGSGKTFTALCAIKDAFVRREVPLILVPSELLLSQWADELRSTFEVEGLRLLVCGGGHVDWRVDGRLRSWTRPTGTGGARAVLATMQTASSEEFRASCRQGDHLFVVADEVHRLGAVQTRSLLALNSGPRLGLSATPRRAGDLEGTAAVLAYFEGVVPPPFTLHDAIASGALTPYAYHVHTVPLEPDEQETWDKLTKEISRIYARSKGDDGGDHGLEVQLKHLLIRRAKVVKAARQKVLTASDIIGREYRRGARWIVYCEDQGQLRDVRDALRANGCADVLEYHTGMAGDGRRTLELFEARGGVVVSIRCLDEGVDIPSVTHALILASSRNPREFIQRRGRVLRRHPGKALAHVHDVLVTPTFVDGQAPGTALLEGELARAVEFGSRAINPGCITDLEQLAISHGVDLKALVDVGLEGDGEDE